METNQNIIDPKSLEELPSEEVQEIMTRSPHWLIRSGLFLFFLVLLIVFAASYIVKYPEIIKAKLKLSSINAPKVVRARTDGLITKLFVKENSVVKKGDILAFIESTASPAEILELSTCLQKMSRIIDDYKSTKLMEVKVLNFKNMGELQQDYQSFVKAYMLYVSYLKGGLFVNKKEFLEKDLADLRNTELNLLQQAELMLEDVELSKQEFEIQQKLLKEKAIAAIEFRKEESKFLSKKMSLKQLQLSIINNKTQTTSKQKELAELDASFSEQQNVFLQSLNTFKSAIEEWEKQHILIAPNGGKVYFSSFFQENQTISKGQDLFYIASSSFNEYGELYLSQYNLGKVKVGQKVLIKFNSYPSEEYGLINGKISYISDVPLRDSVFLAKVDLSNGLITTFNKKLNFKSGISAEAEIITRESRLLQKFFYNFRRAAQ